MKYYEDHERAYQQLFKNGYVGWGERKSVRELLAFPFRMQLEKTLGAHSQFSQRSLLDLGCGTGPISLYCAQLGFECLGIDISPSAVKKASELSAKLGVTASFVCGDFIRAPLPISQFSIIIDSSFLHCIVFDEDRAACLNRIYNLLEPGGIFIVHTMVADGKCEFGPQFELDQNGILWCLDAKSQAFESELRSRGRMSPQRRLLPSVQLEKQLEELGFHKVESEFLYGEQGVDPISLFGVFRK